MKDKDNSKEKLIKGWSTVLKYMKEKVKENEYSSWILNINPVSLDDKYFNVEVDNNFIKETIDSKYKKQINEILNDIFWDEYKELKISVKESENEELMFDIKEKKDTKRGEDKPKNILFSDNLNHKYVFETFIVGKSNDFAHAASEAVSKGPGKVYNPLFIYGGVGLGKTHLMHAIGNYVLSKDPNKKIYYCSSEQFTNDLINSIKNDKMVEFRNKYRKLDVILIDDIQFIAGKESTQEEFFHTFNELYQAGKQIVMTSDRPPKEMDNTEKRLVSRFECGLVTDIQQPDYETRVSILNKKAEVEGLNVSEEVIRYIAEAVNSNIRELEGALNRVIAKGSLLKRAITVELVEEMFYDVLKSKSKVVTKERIINIVSEHYNVSVEDMKSSKRKQEIAKTRQVAMYFLREILQMPFMAIGEIFGGKDHTTVMHSVTKVEDEMKNNRYFSKDINDIKEKITSA